MKDEDIIDGILESLYDKFDIELIESRLNFIRNKLNII